MKDFVNVFASFWLQGESASLHKVQEPYFPVIVKAFAIMASSPKAKSPTGADKGLKQLAKGANTITKSIRAECKKCLDQVPWVLPGVKTYLQSVKAMDADGKPIVAAESAAEDTENGPSLSLAVQSETKHHHTQKKPMNMPVNELRKWLQAMEPSIFTEGNLKASF